MTISRIFHGDVFTSNLQTGEDIVKIACGTNTSGWNNSQWNSVAWKIARDYIPAFENLWKANFWDVHTHTFDFHGRVANALWIVCNEQNPGTWDLDKDTNWDEAVVSLRRGFENIADIFYPTDADDILRELQSQTRVLSESGGKNLPIVLQNALDMYRAKLTPIVRTVLIGTGESGRNANADVAWILEAMHTSTANLHLYLHSQQQAAQVAQVIPLFPNITKLAAVPWYNEIRLVA